MSLDGVSRIMRKKYEAIDTEKRKNISLLRNGFVVATASRFAGIGAIGTLVACETGGGIDASNKYLAQASGWDPVFGPPISRNRGSGTPRDFAGHMETNSNTPGMDYAVEMMTPVTAAAEGVVLKTYPNGGLTERAGNAVIVDHGNLWFTMYLHLAAVSVNEKAVVGRNTVLGYSGNSGTNAAGGAYAPHLHLGIMRLKESLDPNLFGHDGGQPRFWDGRFTMPYRKSGSARRILREAFSYYKGSSSSFVRNFVNPYVFSVESNAALFEALGSSQFRQDRDPLPVKFITSILEASKPPILTLPLPNPAHIDLYKFR